MSYNYLCLCIFISIFFSSCTNQEQTETTSLSPSKATSIGRSVNSAILLRHGQPYFIKGVAGTSRFDRLKASGGNSIRIWDDSDADRVLNQAGKLDLTVMLGLWLEREADGFNYYNEKAVEDQYNRIRKTVLKYRSHPALLMWCVGNEWHFQARNIRVYDEIERITKMIHELDPDHPVTTAIGLTSPRLLWLIKERCPSLDILSVNIYGGMPMLSQRLNDVGWTKPYLISEFGGRGPWESKFTAWNLPIEPTSQKKVDVIEENYQAYIGSRPPNCLGSYVFLWGQKEEGTHTWFSFFDEEGRETALVGAMQKLWTGQSPANLAPVIKQVFVDGYDSTNRSFPVSSAIHRARVVASDPDKDSLSYTWEIRPQAKEHGAFNYYDTPLKPVEGLFDQAKQAETPFRLPQRPGIYRLFVHVYDTHNHVTSANIPLRIGDATVRE